ASLESEHASFFARLMRRCCQVSTEYVSDNGGLYDVLTADAQVVADVFAGREERREAAGYVSPLDAAGFLKSARRPAGERETESQAPVPTAWLREASRSRTPVADGGGRAPGAESPSAHRLVAVLREAGVLPTRETPLLGSGSSDAPGRALVR